MGMNIDNFRNSVITGQIATLTAQIAVYTAYQTATGTSMVAVITATNNYITKLQAMLS